MACLKPSRVLLVLLGVFCTVYSQQAFSNTAELQQAIQRTTQIALSQIKDLKNGFYQAQAQFGTVKVSLKFPWPLQANGAVQLQPGFNIAIPDFNAFFKQLQSQLRTSAILPLIGEAGIANFGLALKGLEFKFQGKKLISLSTTIRIPSWDALDSFDFKILEPTVSILVTIRPSKSLLIKATGKIVATKAAKQLKSLPVEFILPIGRSEPLSLRVGDPTAVIPFDYFGILIKNTLKLALPGIVSKALANLKVQKLNMAVGDKLSNISDFEIVAVATIPWKIGGDFSLEDVTLVVNQSEYFFMARGRLGSEIISLTLARDRNSSKTIIKLEGPVNLPSMESSIKYLLAKTLFKSGASQPDFSFAKLYGSGLSARLDDFELRFAKDNTTSVDLALKVALTKPWTLFNNIPLKVTIKDVNMDVKIKSLNRSPKVTALASGTIAIGNPKFLDYPFVIIIPEQEKALHVGLQPGKEMVIDFNNILKVGGLSELPAFLDDFLKGADIRITQLDVAFSKNLTAKPQVNAFLLRSPKIWDLKILRVGNVSLTYVNKKYVLDGLLEFADIKALVDFKWPPLKKEPVISLPKPVTFKELAKFIEKVLKTFGLDVSIDLNKVGLGSIADFSIEKFDVTLSKDLRKVKELYFHGVLPKYSWKLLEDFFNIQNVSITVSLVKNASVAIEIGGTINVLSGALLIPIRMEVPDVSSKNISIQLARGKDFLKARFSQIIGMLASSVGVQFPAILENFLPDLHIYKLDIFFSKKLRDMKITTFIARCPKRWNVGGVNVLFIENLAINMTEEAYNVSGVVTIGGIVFPVQFSANNFSTPEFQLTGPVLVPDLSSFIRGSFRQVITHASDVPDGKLMRLDGSFAFVIDHANIQFSSNLKSLTFLDIQVRFPNEWDFFKGIFTIEDTTLRLRVTDFGDAQVDYELYISGNIKFSNNGRQLMFPLRVFIPSNRDQPVIFEMTSAVTIEMADIALVPMLDQVIPSGLLTPISDVIGPIRINKFAVHFRAHKPTAILSLNVSTTALKIWKIPGLPLEFGNLTFKIWYRPKSFRALLFGTVTVKGFPISFKLPVLPKIKVPKLKFIPVNLQFRAIKVPKLPGVPSLPDLPGIPDLPDLPKIPDFPLDISLPDIANLLVPGFDLASLFPEPLKAFKMRFAKFDLRLKPPLLRFNLEGFHTVFFLHKPVILVKDWMAIENITADVNVTIKGGLKVGGVLSCTVRLGPPSNAFRIFAELVMPTPPKKTWILRIRAGSKTPLSIGKIVSVLAGGVDVKSFLPIEILQKATRFDLHDLQVHFITEPKSQVIRLSCLLRTDLKDVNLPLKISMKKISLFLKADYPLVKAKRKVNVKLNVWILVGKATVRSTLVVAPKLYRLETYRLGDQALNIVDMSKLVGGNDLLKAIPYGFFNFKAITLEKLNITFTKPGFKIDSVHLVVGLKGFDVGFQFPLPIPDPDNMFRAKLMVSTLELRKIKKTWSVSAAIRTSLRGLPSVLTDIFDNLDSVLNFAPKRDVVISLRKTLADETISVMLAGMRLKLRMKFFNPKIVFPTSNKPQISIDLDVSGFGKLNSLLPFDVFEDELKMAVLIQNHKNTPLLMRLKAIPILKKIIPCRDQGDGIYKCDFTWLCYDDSYVELRAPSFAYTQDGFTASIDVKGLDKLCIPLTPSFISGFFKKIPILGQIFDLKLRLWPPLDPIKILKKLGVNTNNIPPAFSLFVDPKFPEQIIGSLTVPNNGPLAFTLQVANDESINLINFGSPPYITGTVFRKFSMGMAFGVPFIDMDLETYVWDVLYLLPLSYLPKNNPIIVNAKEMQNYMLCRNCFFIILGAIPVPIFAEPFHLRNGYLIDAEVHATVYHKKPTLKEFGVLSKLFTGLVKFFSEKDYLLSIKDFGGVNASKDLFVIKFKHENKYTMLQLPKYTGRFKLKLDVPDIDGKNFLIGFMNFFKTLQPIWLLKTVPLRYRIIDASLNIGSFNLFSLKFAASSPNELKENKNLWKYPVQETGDGTLVITSFNSFLLSLDFKLFAETMFKGNMTFRMIAGFTDAVKVKFKAAAMINLKDMSNPLMVGGEGTLDLFGQRLLEGKIILSAREILVRGKLQFNLLDLLKFRGAVACKFGRSQEFLLSSKIDVELIGVKFLKSHFRIRNSKSKTEAKASVGFMGSQLTVELLRDGGSVKMRAHATVRIGVYIRFGGISVFGVDLGRFSLDTGVQVDVMIAIPGKSSIAASFSFIGATLRIPRLEVHSKYMRPDRLPGLVFKLVKEKALALIKKLIEFNPGKYIKALIDGVVKIGKKVGKVLKELLGKGLKLAGELAKEVGKLVNEIGKAAKEVAKAAKKVAKVAAETAKKAREVAEKGLEVAKETAKKAAKVVKDVGRKLGQATESLYNTIQSVGRVASQVRQAARIASAVGKHIANVARAIGRVARRIAEEIMNGIRNAAGKVIKTISGWFGKRRIYRRDALVSEKEALLRQKRSLQTKESNARSLKRAKERELEKLQKLKKIKESARAEAVKDSNRVNKELDRAINEEIQRQSKVEDIYNKGACVTGEHNCHPNATCLRQGSDPFAYKCACRRGWIGDGVTCHMPIKQVAVVADDAMAVGRPAGFSALTLSGTDVEYRFSFQKGYSSSSYHTNTFNHPGVFTVTAYARNQVSQESESVQIIIQEPVDNIRLLIKSTKRACRNVLVTPAASGTNVSFEIDFGDQSDSVKNTGPMTHIYNKAGKYVITVTARNLVSSMNKSFPIEIIKTSCDELYCDVSRIERVYPKTLWQDIASRAFALARSSHEKVPSDDPPVWDYLSDLYPFPMASLEDTTRITYTTQRYYNINGSKVDLAFVLAGMLAYNLGRHSAADMKKEIDLHSFQILANLSDALLLEGTLQVSDRNLLELWSPRDSTYCNELLVESARLQSTLDGFIFGKKGLEKKTKLSDALFDYYCPDKSQPKSTALRYARFVEFVTSNKVNKGNEDVVIGKLRIAMGNLARRGGWKIRRNVCLRFFSDFVAAMLKGASVPSSNACTSWKSCKECAIFGSQKNCSWCAADSQCRAPESKQPCSSGELTDRSNCPSSCSLNSRCADCISDASCGWCASSSSQSKSQCLEANSRAPRQLSKCKRESWLTGKCKNACPYKNNKLCGGFGICVSGACVCRPGMYGNDCSREGCAYRVKVRQDVNSVARRFKVSLGDLKDINNEKATGIEVWASPNTIITVPVKAESACLNNAMTQLFHPKFPRLLRGAKNIVKRYTTCGLFGSPITEDSPRQMCSNKSKDSCQRASSCSWNLRDPCTGLMIQGCSRVSTWTEVLVSDNQTIHSPISGNADIKKRSIKITGWPNSPWQNHVLTIYNLVPKNITSTQAGLVVGRATINRNRAFPNVIRVELMKNREYLDPAPYLQLCAEGCVPLIDLGNGKCDAACNVEECNYDDGDCAEIGMKRKKIHLVGHQEVQTFTDTTWDFLYSIQRMTDENSIHVIRGPLSVFSLAKVIVSELQNSVNLSAGLLYSNKEQALPLKKVYDFHSLQNKSSGEIIVKTARKIKELGSDNLSPYLSSSNEIQVVDVLSEPLQNEKHFKTALQLMEMEGKVGFVFVNTTERKDSYFHIQVPQGGSTTSRQGVFYDSRVPSSCQATRTCTGHGVCMADGSCFCDKYYVGRNCSMSTCPKNCSNHGTCVEGECICEKGWQGQDCSTVKFCTRLCLDVWIGDGRCDANCDIPKCRHDDGDCTNVCKCPKAWLGDGACDMICNTSVCGFDKGDCIVQTKECSPGCKPSMLGDGYCDRECNTEKCDFDKKDCKVLATCNCPPDLQGNGNCDDQCNNKACYYDYGDCSSKVKVDRKSCPKDCRVSMIGNSFCDLTCNVSACAFDGGDCKLKPKEERFCNPGCVSSFLKDGSCDSVCNVKNCGYDGGDCPKPVAKMCSPGCEISQVGDGECQKPCLVEQCSYDGKDCECAPGCKNASIGNGKCDPECHVEACGFDGDDCSCPRDKCPKNIIGNGICDLHCNTKVCEFDGGDCVCAPGCSISSVSDNWCDPECDNKACSFDGLDCGGCEADAHTKLCDKNAECYVKNDSLPFVRCRCKSGYYGDGFTCIKQGKCYGNKKDVCSKRAKCLNINGTFECHCQKGWKGNGIFCDNINECLSDDNRCSKYATCRDTPGSYVCECNPGYKGDGKTCSDIDECTDKKYHHECCGNEQCINTDGSYQCTCADGWREVNGTEDERPPGQCVMRVDVPYFMNLNCTDIDECGEGIDNCSRINGVANSVCKNTAGGFNCTCESGWEGDGWYCKDIDECARQDICGANQVCRNTAGSFTCACKKGWVFNVTGTGQCEDQDECALGISDCHEFANCINTNGSYECHCREGFSDTGRKCLKYECKSNEGSKKLSVFRAANFTVSLNSSDLCSCVGGYINVGRECADFDECRWGSYKCPKNAPVCFNTQGGYECQCDADRNETCESFDPCASNNTCSKEMRCVASGKDHYCVCPEGYVDDPSGPGCIDKDECKFPDVYQCPENAYCINIVGSYECKCRKGFLESGGSCFEINECDSTLSYNATGHLLECQPGVCDSVRTCVWPPTNESYVRNASLICACEEGNSKELDCMYAKVTITQHNISDINNVTTTLVMPWDTIYNATGPKGVIPPLFTHNCSRSLAKCVNTLGSYECQCADGYYTTDAGRHCLDIDECLKNDSCHANATCANTAGSFSCTCKKGFTGNGRDCTDLDECKLGTDNCHVNATCINVPGGFRCECKSGFKGAEGDCIDVDECSKNNLNKCHPRSTCSNFIGGYKCTCNNGYQGNGFKCRDINECSNSSNLCGEHATCYNTPGSYKCTCDRGWQGDGKTCRNINECEMGLHTCVEHSACDDYPGGFVCHCRPGWIRQWFEPYGHCSKCDSKVLCSGHGQCLRDGSCDCLSYYQGSKCDVCNANVRCSGHGSCDFNATCSCAHGWTRRPLDCSLCVPQDLCSGHGKCNYDLISYKEKKCFCDASHRGNDCSRACPVSNGEVCGLHGDCPKDASFKLPCACHAGFEWNTAARDCVDIDECKKASHNCISPATCVNTAGSFRCKCPSLVGWKFDGQRCTDIDECKFPDVCDKNSKCENYPGGFRCKCNVGYRGPGEHPVCKDIDECAEKTHRCPVTSKCVNTVASYNCVCNKGYNKVSQFRCVDIDECARGIHGCRANSRCLNTIGSWKCLCNNGWYPDPKAAQIPVCKDVNECVDKKGACPKVSVCVNNAGSYRCNCIAGYRNTGLHTCADVDECRRNPCPSNSRCSNTIGSYRCSCNNGYNPRPPAHATRCTDINECTMGRYSCPAFSHCVNTVGSYRCDCNRCYYKSGAVCKADCRNVQEAYHYYTTTYYKSYYTTKCGFLNLKRCTRSRTKSKKVKQTGYRVKSVANRPGARCPCT